MPATLSAHFIWMLGGGQCVVPPFISWSTKLPPLWLLPADADALDIDGFLRLLKVASSTDHLDQVLGPLLT